MITRVHCRRKKYTLYIGRPNKNSPDWGFGNPWVIGRHGNRDQVIEKYKKWLTDGEADGNRDATPERREWILANLHLLEGQILGCFCNEDENCHGDVLIELYNSKKEDEYWDRECHTTIKWV